MTEQEELENKAYLIATGNFLTERLSYEEFQASTNYDLSQRAWQPFEQWDGGQIATEIVSLADSIISAFKPKT